MCHSQNSLSLVAYEQVALIPVRLALREGAHSCA
jgi:hypothetical protein